MSYTEQPAPPRPEQRPQDSPGDQQHSEWPDDVTAEELPHTDRPGVVDDQPVRAPSDGQLPPGGSAADPIAALWGADLVRGYRERWEQVQLSFVDDPRQAAGQAAQLLDEALGSLTGALTSQKQSLDGWQRDDGGDTEVLRTALQHYREFLDRLLGM